VRETTSEDGASSLPSSSLVASCFAMRRNQHEIGAGTAPFPYDYEAALTSRVRL
jgi:hypothetical protein